MTTLRKYLEEKIRSHRKILIPYITLGDPDFDTSLKLAHSLTSAGGDVLEIGIPFSDPLADGPTIQRAINRALRNNVNLTTGFEFLRQFSAIPVVFMTYLNPLLAYGIKRFFHRAGKLKLAGIVIPDLPLEEAGEIYHLAKKNDIGLSLFISPTTSLSRVEKIAKLTDSFIYYISVTGVTGVRKRFPPRLIQNLSRIKKIVNRPLCLGFGISSPSQVKEIKRYVDGIIVGSAIVNRIEDNLGNIPRMREEIFKFVNSLRKVLDEKDTCS